MPRIELHVPFDEKDAAKKHGARWDPVKKLWYIPEGVNPKPLEEWIPNNPHVNIRAKSYYIAESVRNCWKCDQLTAVFGIALPPGYESLIVKEAPKENYWARLDKPTLIYYVDYIPESVQNRFGMLTKYYRWDYSHTIGGSYWMNHCEYCGMKQGDYDLYEEPQGAFFPMTPDEATQILLWHVHEPFAGSCGVDNEGIELFEFMQKK